MALKQWAQQREVVRKLDKLGPSPRIAGRVDEPFALDRDAGYFAALDKKRDAAGSLSSAIKAAPYGFVRLDDLHSPQGGVDAKLVVAKAAHLDDTDSLGVVGRWRGRHYVIDGNHRMTAAKLSGKRLARVRVLDLGDD